MPASPDLLPTSPEDLFEFKLNFPSSATLHTPHTSDTRSQTGSLRPSLKRACGIVMASGGDEPPPPLPPASASSSGAIAARIRRFRNAPPQPPELRARLSGELSGESQPPLWWTTSTSASASSASGEPSVSTSKLDGEDTPKDKLVVTEETTKTLAAATEKTERPPDEKREGSAPTEKPAPEKTPEVTSQDAAAPAEKPAAEKKPTEAEAAPAEKPAAEAKPGAAAPEEKATATATAKPAQAARTPAPAPEPEIEEASQQRPARVETVQDVANSRRTPEGIPTQRWSYGNRRAPTLRGLEPLPPNATQMELKGALKLAQADAVRAIDLLREVEAERDWLLAQLEAREDQNAKLCEDVEMLHVMLEDALTPPMTTDGSTQTKHKAPYERDLSADFDPVATSSYVDVREGVALTEEQAMAIREADPTRPVARVLKNGTSAEQAYFNEMFKLRRALASQGNRLVPHQRYETYKGFGYSGRGARTSWGHNPSKPAPP